MFSVKEKREISDAIQKILRATNHPELPKDEIQFELRVSGGEIWSYTYIRNNGAVKNPEANANPWNEQGRDEMQRAIDRARGGPPPLPPQQGYA